MVFENNDGTPTGAFLRSTNTQQEKPFRGMANNSDRATGYFSFGGGKDATVACIFESGIDAMSYAGLQKASGNAAWEGRYYVASGGTGDSNILTFLQGHPNVNSVILCHDNDAGGHKQAESLGDKLRPMGYNVSRSVPRGKDFNEDLLDTQRQPGAGERQAVPIAVQDFVEDFVME